MPRIQIQSENLPAAQKFTLTYGEAMLQWAYVEDRMFSWFHRLTGMDEDMARAVFFSARSFQGRLDMMSAVIAEKADDGSLTGDNLTVISEIVAKAALYSSSRNSLAHGLSIFLNNPNGALELLLVQGKHKAADWHKVGIEETRILIIGKNFQALQILMMDALRTYMSGGSTPILECLERLRLLPNVPDSETPSQKQLGRQRQRKLARSKR